MKKIADVRILTGQHEIITAMDFRKSPGEVLLQVTLGKKFTITRNGKAVAVIKAAVEPELAALELGAAVRKLGLAGK